MRELKYSGIICDKNNCKNNFEIKSINNGIITINNRSVNLLLASKQFSSMKWTPLMFRFIMSNDNSSSMTYSFVHNYNTTNNINNVNTIKKKYFIEVGDLINLNDNNNFLLPSLNKESNSSDLGILLLSRQLNDLGHFKNNNLYKSNIIYSLVNTDLMQVIFNKAFYRKINKKNIITWLNKVLNYDTNKILLNNKQEKYNIFDLLNQKDINLTKLNKDINLNHIALNSAASQVLQKTYKDKDKILVSDILNISKKSTSYNLMDYLDLRFNNKLLIFKTQKLLNKMNYKLIKNTNKYNMKNDFREVYYKNNITKHKNEENILRSISKNNSYMKNKILNFKVQYIRLNKEDEKKGLYIEGKNIKNNLFSNFISKKVIMLHSKNALRTLIPLKAKNNSIIDDKRYIENFNYLHDKRDVYNSKNDIKHIETIKYIRRNLISLIYNTKVQKKLNLDIIKTLKDVKQYNISNNLRKTNNKKTENIIEIYESLLSNEYINNNIDNIIMDYIKAKSFLKQIKTYNIELDSNNHLSIASFFNNKKATALHSATLGNSMPLKAPIYNKFKLHVKSNKTSLFNQIKNTLLISKGTYNYKKNSNNNELLEYLNNAVTVDILNARHKLYKANQKINNLYNKNINLNQVIKNNLLLQKENTTNNYNKLENNYKNKPIQRLRITKNYKKKNNNKDILEYIKNDSTIDVLNMGHKLYKANQKIDNLYNKKINLNQVTKNNLLLQKENKINSYNELDYNNILAKKKNILKNKINIIKNTKFKHLYSFIKVKYNNLLKDKVPLVYFYKVKLFRGNFNLIDLVHKKKDGTEYYINDNNKTNDIDINEWIEIYNDEKKEIITDNPVNTAYKKATIMSWRVHNLLTHKKDNLSKINIRDKTKNIFINNIIDNYLKNNNFFHKKNCENLLLKKDYATFKNISKFNSTASKTQFTNKQQISSNNMQLNKNEKLIFKNNNIKSNKNEISKSDLNKNDVDINIADKILELSKDSKSIPELNFSFVSNMNEPQKDSIKNQEHISNNDKENKTTQKNKDMTLSNIDIKNLVDTVYKEIQKRQRIERERRGVY